MNQLIIEDLDSRILERLKVRAQRQGRTLEAELKAILEAAALEVTILSKDEEDRVLVKSVQKTPEELGYPPGFFERTYGCLADDPIVIDDEGISDADEEDRGQVQLVKKTPEELGWSPGFFEEVIGGWQGELLTRGEQGKYEQRLWELL